MLNAQVQTPPNNECFQRDLHGGAIVDSNGREIPMTAEMIDTVLEQLSLEQDEKQKKYNFIPF